MIGWDGVIETVLGICLGIGLAASCGFRVFLPCLLAGLGRHYDVEILGALPEWMGSTPALIVMGVATLGEIAAYYIPWVDNALDTVASPAAVLAGILLFGAANWEMDPLWRWSLAAVAGGTAAGTTQAATVLTRAVSVGTSGGLLNPVVSTLEAVLAVVTSVLAMLIPPLVIVMLGLAVWWLVRMLRRRRERKQAASSVAA